MNTKEFLADDRFVTDESKSVREHPDPKIRDIGRKFVLRRAARCADGFTLSIQYSAGHYCNAREPFMGGEWDGKGPAPEPKSVEIGFPSKREPLLKEYAEEPKRMTKTVYGWVPIEVVDTVLAKHGGIVAVRSEDYSKWEKVA